MESTYHHGNLRQALIDAALHITREHGIKAVTIRRVARSVGVSHAAPYHHFADRSNLIAAVAEQGFQQLAQKVSEAEGAGADQLREAGVAYVVFAVRDPELFRLMFGREASDSDGDPGLASAAAAARSALVNAFPAVDASSGEVPVNETLVNTCWALVHGLAMLIINGQLPQTMTPEAAAELSRESLDLVWSGLRQ